MGSTTREHLPPWESLRPVLALHVFTIVVFFFSCFGWFPWITLPKWLPRYSRLQKFDVQPKYALMINVEYVCTSSFRRILVHASSHHKYSSSNIRLNYWIDHLGYVVSRAPLFLNLWLIAIYLICLAIRAVFPRIWLLVPGSRFGRTRFAVHKIKISLIYK